MSEPANAMVDEWQALGIAIREAGRSPNGARACFICGIEKVLVHRNPGIWMCAYGHDDEGRSLTPRWLLEADDAPPPPPRKRRPLKPRPFRYGL